jgi:hypothetical protein
VTGRDRSADRPYMYRPDFVKVLILRDIRPEKLF